MRYEVTDRVLQLALAMQGSRLGLSLLDIERDFDVSRRTAQRMREGFCGTIRRPSSSSIPNAGRAGASPSPVR